MGRGATEQVIDDMFERFALESPYLQLLDRIHQHLVPRTYVEIGIHIGSSLMRVLPGTDVIGVDPELGVYYPLPPRSRLFAMTSDDFFASHDPQVIFGGRRVDLSFIDGMHRFEFSLRDFMHLETCSAPGSIILVHDCYPSSARQADRAHRPGGWSGDVWKLIACLKEYRPDLKVAVADVAPSGLAIIGDLDPTSRVLPERYEEICERFVPLPYGWLEEHGRSQVLNRIGGDWPSVRAHLPPSPFDRRKVRLRKAQRLALVTAVMAPRWLAVKGRQAFTGRLPARSGQGL